MRAGDVLSRRFVIETVAGAGGMGVVYRARDNATGRVVAIKTLSLGPSGTSDRPATDAPREGAADALERFDHEVALMQRLDHPHIVRYVGHGRTEAGGRFVALDWLDGEDLADRLSRGPLSVRETLTLARALTEALESAHAVGVVHRDLKPANVFLVDGRVELAKLLDFGVARSSLARRGATLSGTMVGTPAYMSPEQARGDAEVDARADLFSLGCVLFECLSGRAPFVGKHVVATLAKILFDPPPPLASLRGDVPATLAASIERMLAKEATARPASAVEVRAALNSIDLGTARLASVAPRPLEDRITSSERRLFGVVLLRRAATAGERVSGDDVTRASDTDATRAASAVLRALGAPLGASAVPLVDGSSLLVFEGRALAGLGAATDLALCAARSALALLAEDAGLDIAIAVGSAVATDRLPVGEVLDRVAALLARAARRPGPRRVRIDDIGAGLVGDRVHVRADEDGFWIDGERVGDAPRLLLGRPSAFVGRAHEMGVLEAAVVGCFADRQSGGAIVRGAAGLGKSRLRRELLRSLGSRMDASPETWIVRGDPLAPASAFGAIGRMLREVLGVAEGEALELRQRRVRARVARHVRADQVELVSCFVAEIVGAPFSREHDASLRAAAADPALLGDHVRRALEALIVAEAEAGPLVLVLEDAQWSDAPSLRLFESLLAREAELALFVLACARDEGISALTGLAQRARVVTVTLRELSTRAATQLVRDALPAELSEPIRSRTLETLVARGSGNALVLEELVRAHVEGAVSLDLTLPDTVVAILQMRLAHLAPELRRVLRAASVLGTRFWAGGVHAILGASSTRRELEEQLAVLVAEELVLRAEVSRFDGEAELVFRQPSMCEAAQASLTDADRATAHRLAADWLESHGERDPRVLAEHRERARQPSLSAAWLLRAAEQAMVGDDVSTALALLGRARKAAREAQPELLASIALLTATAHRWRSELALAEQHAEDAVALFARGSAGWFRAVLEALEASSRRGVYDRALAWRARIDGVVLRGAESARMLALCAAGRSLFHAGRYDIADEIAAMLGDELEGATGLEPVVAAEIHRLLGASARHRGDLASDRRHYERALAEHERAGDARQAENCRVSVGFAALEMGEDAVAEAHLTRALGAAERMGLGAVTLRARQSLGLLAHRRGELEDARTGLRGVAEALARSANERFEGWTRIYLARVELDAGCGDAAEREASRAAVLLASAPARAGALACLAEVALTRGALEDAERHVAEAMAVLARHGSLEEFESFVWLAQLDVIVARGDLPSARDVARAARASLERRLSAIEDDEARARLVSVVPDHHALASRCEVLLGRSEIIAIATDRPDPEPSGTA